MKQLPRALGEVVCKFIFAGVKRSIRNEENTLNSIFVTANSSVLLSTRCRWVGCSCVRDWLESLGCICVQDFSGSSASQLPVLIHGTCTKRAFPGERGKVACADVDPSAWADLPSVVLASALTCVYRDQFSSVCLGNSSHRLEGDFFLRILSALQAVLLSFYFWIWIYWCGKLTRKNADSQDVQYASNVQA